ncbi:hypothetical protein DL546_003334 [Coniochaeta pulveracea]|uniref:Cell surface protein n=1 Tax=Coniochaeta pulveracea TaxID=177199 RepID=A0A420Y903_9PEZI|nr:hypothetical protein DL546_003334 [Coniochaeta pulveracea]
MSGIINKVKDALHGDKHDETTHHTGNTGHHSNLTDASQGGYGSAQGGYAQGTAHGSGPTFNEDGSKTGHTGPSGLGTSTQGGGLTGTHHSNTNTGYGSETGGFIQGTAHGAGPAHTTHGTVTGGGLTGTHHQNTNTGGGSREGEYGPHGNRAANALDPRVDSDRDGSHNTGNHGSSGTHGTSGGFTGSSATHREGEHGPHSSRVANALDPRVDSDRDGSHNTHTSGGGLSGVQHTSNTSGGYGSSNTGYGSSGTREGEHGPHGSRVANAVDPRVDSDRDGSRRVAGETGSHGVQTGYGVGGAGSNTSGTVGGYGSDNYGTAGEYGSNTHGSHNTHGTSGGFTGSSATHREGEHGPHSSRVANALDPRVDSDRDGSRNAGQVGFGNAAGTHETGLHGTTGGLGGNTHSTYGSSGNTGYGNTHESSGATSTAGPHNSNMLNKLDPRVDSDRDGSRTVGGNNTYESGTGSSGLGNRDPHDAAQVPPSVLQKVVGPPTIEHDDHHHGRQRRNSRPSDQETHFTGASSKGH